MKKIPPYWNAHIASLWCLAGLGEKGLTVKPTVDADEIAQSISKIGKPYLTPLLDPGCNDFTSSNYFWLIADLDGEPVMVGGCRMDIVPDDEDNFLFNQLSRCYGGDAVKSVHPEVKRAIRGRVCYFGDLYSLAGVGLSQRYRRLFLGVAHYIASAHFCADVTYSFMRDRDVRRGSADINGFDCRLYQPVEWGAIPEARDPTELIVYRHKSSNFEYFENLRLE